jgi:hypothetical protein
MENKDIITEFQRMNIEILSLKDEVNQLRETLKQHGIKLTPINHLATNSVSIMKS